ncbi:CvpA family protein [Wukongibacter baidiensis]|uniref:CvpA family protein n=1 Tax=Wukongibacter baidiensis TaxID=1723361 RepID=UPI003D7FDE0E
MDICVIIIITINGIRGLGAGLVLSLFNIASYIVAGIVAKLYYPYLSKFVIENTNWAFKVQEFVLKNMKFKSADAIQAQGGGYESIFEVMNLPKALETVFLQSNFFTEYSDGVLNNINIYISQMVAKIVIDLLCIIIIFFIAKLILSILCSILNSITELPIIKQFNRLGGLIFGALKGIIIIYIFTAVMVPIASIFPNSSLVNSLEASKIARVFYDYNILLFMLKNMISYGGSKMIGNF